jgi:hypothetical protein
MSRNCSVTVKCPGCTMTMEIVAKYPTATADTRTEFICIGCDSEIQGTLKLMARDPKTGIWFAKKRALLVAKVKKASPKLLEAMEIAAEMIRAERAEKAGGVR